MNVAVTLVILRMHKMKVAEQKKKAAEEAEARKKEEERLE
tara:strand:- start:308 stop:427 length:120 start_codon:yes stop_codon:yes gene_type:complete